eukprot:15432553-Alexandrium_andersonii.AAC.1
MLGWGVVYSFKRFYSGPKASLRVSGAGLERVQGNPKQIPNEPLQPDTRMLFVLWRAFRPWFGETLFPASVN